MKLKALLVIVSSIALGLGCGVEPSTGASTPELGSPRRASLASTMKPNSPLTGFTVGNGNSQVYYIDTSNHVSELEWRSASNGWYYTDVTGSLSASPAAPDSPLTGFAFVGGSVPRVYYIAANNRDIHELWYDTQWHDKDLNQETGAPVATPGSALVGLALGTRSGVYYEGWNGHVYELFWTGTAWGYDDVTQGAGLPTTGHPESLTALAVNNHSLPRVYLQGADGAMYELWWDTQAWHYNNLSGMTGAPMRYPNTGVTAFAVNNTLSHVFYIADNLHVIELRFNGSTWGRVDISQLTNAENVLLFQNAVSPLTGFALNGSSPRVYFISSSGIHELASNDDVFWSDTILTGSAGAPFPGLPSSLASFAYNGYPRVYFEGNNQNAYELWLGLTWQWNNLTTWAN